MKYALKEFTWAAVPCAVLLLSTEGATGQPAAAAPCLSVGSGGFRAALSWSQDAAGASPTLRAGK